MKKLICCITAVVIALSLSIGAFAVPSRPANMYVLDKAQVISNDTEQYIIEKNRELFNRTGAEIVVAAVSFTDGKDMEEYTYEMFNSWGVGSTERNNGLLLVLAIENDDYYALAGDGISELFDGARISEMLYDFLEADFAEGNYDEGVLKFFNQVKLEMESYYSGSEYYDDGFGTGGGYTYPDDSYNDYQIENINSGFHRFIIAVALIFSFIIILLAVIIIATKASGNRNDYYGGPMPPNTYSGGYPPMRRRAGGFWTGLFIGNILGNNRNRRPPFGGGPPHSGGWGGPGGFSSGAGSNRGSTGRSGGFSSGGRSSKGSSGRSGGFSSGGRSSKGGSGRSGGFSSGGGSSRGGGAGRR